MVLTKEIIKGCLPGASSANIEKYAPALIQWCKKFGIDTPLRIVHFLAQVGTESGDFKYSHELGNAAYFIKYDTGKIAKMLGNTPEKDGDGAKYKGRGLIQVTGKANYTAFSKWYFGATSAESLTFVDKPELVENPVPAVASAVWYWTTRNLNALADKDDVLAITKKINGGTNGLNERKKRVAFGKKYFNLE